MELSRIELKLSDSLALDARAQRRSATIERIDKQHEHRVRGRERVGLSGRDDETAASMRPRSRDDLHRVTGAEHELKGVVCMGLRSERGREDCESSAGDRGPRFDGAREHGECSVIDADVLR